MKPDELIAKLIKDYGMEVVNALSEYMDENLPLINELEEIEKKVKKEATSEALDQYHKLMREGASIDVTPESRARFWKLASKDRDK